MFGEIIYGGHIVEDWDRRLASAYLAKCMNDGLLENAELFPSFVSPPSTLHKSQVSPIYLERMYYDRRIVSKFTYEAYI